MTALGSLECLQRNPGGQPAFFENHPLAAAPPAPQALSGILHQTVSLTDQVHLKHDFQIMYCSSTPRLRSIPWSLAIRTQLPLQVCLPAHCLQYSVSCCRKGAAMKCTVNCQPAVPPYRQQLHFAFEGRRTVYPQTMTIHKPAVKLRCPCCDGKVKFCSRCTGSDFPNSCLFEAYGAAVTFLETGIS